MASIPTSSVAQPGQNIWSTPGVSSGTTTSQADSATPITPLVPNTAPTTYTTSGGSLVNPNNQYGFATSGVLTPGYNVDANGVPTSVGGTPAPTPAGAFTNSTPTSSVVSSSGPASNAAGAVGAGISNAQANPPVTTDPSQFGSANYDPSQDPTVQGQITTDSQPYTQYQQQLASDYKQQLADLASGEQGTEAAATAASNQQISIATRNMYAEAGGSASAQGYLIQLGQQHQQEMAGYQAKYNATVAAAQQAYDAANFDVAQKLTAEANTIKTAAQTRNNDYLDQMNKAQTLANENTKTQIAQQNQADAETKNQQDFLKSAGITGSTFYQYPGSATVYDSATGKALTADQYAAMGGVGQAGGYKDISVVDTAQVNSTNDSPEYKEWLDYQKTGGQLNFNDYSTMDANRKAPKISVTTGDANTAAGVISDVNSMINPSVAGPGKVINGKQVILNGVEIVGRDGKMNPAFFLKQRALVPTSQLSKFDAEYGPDLNSVDRGNLGVGSYNVNSENAADAAS